jgi:FtsH-binding integral membrane protein
MPSCNNYFGKLFAHLAAVLAVSAVSSETSNIGSTMYGNSTVLVKTIANLVILFALMSGIFLTKPGGIPKYAFFIGFAFWIGQILKPYVTRLKDKKILTNILILTTGVFVGMMALGFYDNMNLLGFGPYLFAGLIGLILAQLLVLALGTPEEKKQGFQFLRFFGIALFAAYTAYDVQVLRQNAKMCRNIQKNLKMDPDYPVESIALYLDFLNLFVKIGNNE